MKTILVLGQNPELPNTIRTALEAHPYRIIHRADLDEAEPLLKQAAMDVCIVDADQPQAQAMWVIEKLRELSPSIAIFVFSTIRSPEWEEMAYLRGVSQVLPKPVRGRLLRSLLERTAPRARSIPARVPPLSSPSTSESHTPNTSATAKALEILSPVAKLLPHAHSAPALFEHILPVVREALGIHRIIVFLRPNPPGVKAPSNQPEQRVLRPLAATGVSLRVLENFELSLQEGVAAHFSPHQNILRRTDPEIATDTAAIHEMDVLGIDAAVTILHEDWIIGVVGLGRRLDGRPLEESIIQQAYYFFEPTAVMVRSMWATEQLNEGYQMMTGILRELNSACVLVGRDLRILHANNAARQMLLPPADQEAELNFSDLPQALSSRIYQVLRTGANSAPFRFRPADQPQKLYQVSTIIFQSKDTLLPSSLLLMMEELSQAEQLKKLEIEAANLRLVRTMADRLAHEIGNALVPVSTHQQLLPTRHKDPEFRSSLENALASSVKRISRLVNQMVYLAQDRPMSITPLPLQPLLEDAFREAQRHLPIQSATLRQSHDSSSPSISGDRDALKQAFAEVFINALQANPADAKVAVRSSEFSDDDGTVWLMVEVLDNGEGFNMETSHQAMDPFFTTRSVGLGLGLTVSRKVIETHQGKLEIVPATPSSGGMIRISFPTQPPSL